MDRRDRARLAAVTAAIGAVALALTAAAARLDTPPGWAVHGVIVGAIAGWVAGPWIARGRPMAIAALAVVLDLTGVLLFPLLGPPLGLEPPLGGPVRIDQWLASLGPMLALTPLGFLSALPFVPAIVATAVLTAVVAGRRRPSTAIPADAPGSASLRDQERPVSRPDGSADRPEAGADVWDSVAAHRRAQFAGAAADARHRDEEYRRILERSRGDAARADVDPEIRADRQFERAVRISLTAVTAITLVGFVWLAIVGQGIGY